MSFSLSSWRMEPQMPLSSSSTLTLYPLMRSAFSTFPFDSSFCSMLEMILQLARLAPMTFLYATLSRLRSSTVSSCSGITSRTTESMNLTISS